MLALPERSYIFYNKLDILDIKTKISNCRSVSHEDFFVKWCLDVANIVAYKDID